MAENWGQHRAPVNHDRAGPSRLCNADFSDNVPVGLRVLIYSDNLVNLHNYMNYLGMNDYKVFTTSSEERAVSLLSNHRNSYDIALIEVHKPDGHIFQSISQIGNQLDCPIIVISKDASKAAVMKWMSNGAWDCLIEPIRIENDLKFIFKHVVRMRAQRSMVAGEKAAGDTSSSVGPNYNGNHSSEASTSKKKRCVWDSTLRKKFSDAVNHIGIKSVNPNKILARMDVPNLTRDNVASYLQKYRQKEKEKENSLNISEDKTKNIGEDSTELTRKKKVKSETSLINNSLQPFSEQQNIISSINNFIPYPNPVPSTFMPHVPYVMTQQYHFFTQQNSTNYPERTNPWDTIMNDEMGFANGSSLNGYETDPIYNLEECNLTYPETDPQLYNVDGRNLMDPETDLSQLFFCNVDTETDSECNNNSTYPDQNNN